MLTFTAKFHMRQFTGHDIKKILLGESFQMALRYTIGSFIPLLIFRALGDQHTGFELMLGAIIVCGADKREPVKIKVKTMLITVLLSFTVSLTVHFAAYEYYALLLLIFVFIFLLTFVAPFGNRYANTAFMGNLAIIIALSTYKAFPESEDIVHHCLLLLAGGIWYAFFAIVISLVSTPYQLKQSVSKCMEQTIAYLQQRVKLFDTNEDLGIGLLTLSERYTDLTYTQVELRDFLFQRMTPLRRKKSHERKMLVIFVELLDIEEAALATPIDYQRWHQWLAWYPELRLVPEISNCMVKELDRQFKRYFTRMDKRNSFIPDIIEKMRAAALLFESFEKENTQEEDRKTAYRRAYRIRIYQEIQLKKLEALQLILDGRLEEAQTYVDDSAYQKFANAPQISWAAIKDNLNLRSSHFRFALRTTTTAIAGYLIGSLLGFQNPFWVLLTVLVILKPGYSIARQRLVHRIIGTIGGAVIAYGLYLLHPSSEMSLVIFGVSFFLAFCFVLNVYAVTSLFFTIYVIFLYSFLHREIPSSVLFRVIDTTMGGGLCWLAMHYLLPSWEYSNFPFHLKQSLASSLVFFLKIRKKTAGEALTVTEYRLARKQATINLANLVSSYQRIKGEPLKARKNASEYGNLILLNTALLSVISSIGIFISDFPSSKKISPSTQDKLAKTGELIDLLSRQIQTHTVKQPAFEVLSDKALQHVEAAYKAMPVRWK